MKSALPPGKLPPDMLDRLLGRFSRNDPSVLVGPHLGEDAAVIDMGDRLLVAKTDPITFATDRIGSYLVNVNANDLACMGAKPRWLLVTCLLPEGEADEAMVEELFSDLCSACDALGITVCGGHTEVTLGLDRTLLVGQLLGEVAHGDLVDKSRVREGDALLLTKGLAIEGTCVLARDCAGALQGKVDDNLLQRARRFIDVPGISVVRDAQIALAAAGDGVHGMHDPTEGGLWQGVREMAARAGAGVSVDAERVFVFPETQALCEALGLDPMGLLASGALLLAVDPSCEARLLEALNGEGAPCTRIGEICKADRGVTFMRQGRTFPVPWVQSDELTRAFCADKK